MTGVITGGRSFYPTSQLLLRPLVTRVFGLYSSRMSGYARVLKPVRASLVGRCFRLDDACLPALMMLSHDSSRVPSCASCGDDLTGSQGLCGLPTAWEGFYAEQSDRQNKWGEETVTVN